MNPFRQAHLRVMEKMEEERALKAPPGSAEQIRRARDGTIGIGTIAFVFMVGALYHSIQQAQPSAPVNNESTSAEVVAHFERMCVVLRNEGASCRVSPSQKIVTMGVPGLYNDGEGAAMCKEWDRVPGWKLIFRNDDTKEEIGRCIL